MTYSNDRLARIDHAAKAGTSATCPETRELVAEVRASRARIAELEAAQAHLMSTVISRRSKDDPDSWWPDDVVVDGKELDTFEQEFEWRGARIAELERSARTHSEYVQVDGRETGAPHSL